MSTSVTVNYTCPFPQISDRHDVLIKAASTGICGSDLHYYAHGQIGNYILTPPMTLGHESAGIVQQTGPEVTSIKVGDRVALELGIPCRYCNYCRKDHCLDVEMGNTLAALSILGGNSHIPPGKVMSAWSPLENRQLRTFLSTRGHLSWSRIVLEYKEIHHNGRIRSSVAGQAGCLGLSIGCKSRKKPARPANPARSFVVESPVLNQTTKTPSTERTTLTKPVQHPTGICLGEEIPERAVRTATNCKA